MPAEGLRRAVDDEVGAVLERPQVDRRRRSRVDDHRRRVGGRRREIGHRQERVGRRLEQDEVGVVGRRARLVELDVAQAPGGECLEQLPSPVVGTFRQRDRLPRPKLREHERGDRSGAGREEERGASFEGAELALRRCTGRMAVALVPEAAGISVLVRPDGRAVEGLHVLNSTVSFDVVRRLCLLSSFLVEKAER